MVRAKAARAAGAQREGGPEGEFDAPSFSGPSEARAWRTPQGSSRLHGGGACYAFTPCPRIPMLRAEATSLASSSFLPPPWPPSAEMGVIRLEGDLGSDYLGWKLAPCVFFHPAQDWGGGEQLLHHQPGRANCFHKHV